ncbi:hypothetical protein F5B22DRAFT_27170 [Xylaria bambusicola]|uniref:uncharacterized protein n=1 Tax=Xylaria bambusicola TaxID=326684 RepID=UPI002008E3C1|nr:uncharacterized protein F5B22DRAFT_27170 [Xylaria bambusicola]KAI0528223.1 hypothetical protein F5B22DRAFT_27170 [Xylaria bambusicola]
MMLALNAHMLIQAFGAAQHPKLEALRNLNPGSFDYTNVFHLQAPNFDGLVASSISGVNSLDQFLKRFVIIELPGSRPDAKKYLAENPELNPFYRRDKMNDLFSAVDQYWQSCTRLPCEGQHHPVLFLRPPELPDLLLDCLFSLKEVEEPPWGECRIRWLERRKNVTRKFVKELESRAGRCSRMQAQRLILNFAEAMEAQSDCIGKLGSEVLDQKQRPSFELATLVSLGDILAQSAEAPVLNEETKILLAFALAFGVLAWSGSYWLPTQLIKDRIYFFQDKEKLYLEPVISPPSGNEHLLMGTEVDDDPYRLALGVILAELWEEEGWEASLEDNTDNQAVASVMQDADTMVSQTRSTFQNIEWNNNEFYEYAVGTCLDVIESVGNSAPLIHDDKYQDFLLENVFEPLLQQVLAIPACDPLKLAKALKTKTMPPIERVSQPTIQLTDCRHTELNDAKVRHALGFLGEFRPIVQQFCLDKENEKYFSALGDRQKVKIAILDTGLDPLHGQFAPKLAEIGFKNFEDNCCNDDSTNCIDHRHCKDEDGHGTFIAGIIDRVWDISELYVGKVASKRETARDYTQFVNSVAKGIFWACDRWEVDIINLSLGFPVYKEALRPIRDALDHAASKRVLVFSASHNFGNSRSAPWPASEPGLTIPVTAADMTGKLATFARQPQSSGENVMALGECLESSYALPGSQKVHYESRRLNATSFATPIVACMAAVVIYVLDNVNYPYEQEGASKGLRTVKVMKEVLFDTFGRPEDVGLHYLRPSFSEKRAKRSWQLGENIRFIVRKEMKHE